MQDCGRLLYMGQNDWVHANCALWTAEVYEEMDGMLQKVHTAVARGRKLVRIEYLFITKRVPIYGGKQLFLASARINLSS